MLLVLSRLDSTLILKGSDDFRGIHYRKVFCTTKGVFNEKGAVITVALTNIDMQVFHAGPEGLSSDFFLGRGSCFRHARCCLTTNSRDLHNDFSEGHPPQLARLLLSPPQMVELPLLPPRRLWQQLPAYIRYDITNYIHEARTTQRITTSYNKDDDDNDNRERGRLRPRIWQIDVCISASSCVTLASCSATASVCVCVWGNVT